MDYSPGSMTSPPYLQAPPKEAASTDFTGPTRKAKKNETSKKIITMFSTTPENASEIVKAKWLELGPINMNN